MPLTITSQELERTVAAESRARNFKEVSPLPAHLRNAMEKAGLKPIRIFNVGDKTWRNRAGGNVYYHIDACEPGKKFSKPTEIPVIPTYAVAVDLNKAETRYEDAMAVAMDVVGNGPQRGGSDNLIRHGVFIAAGEVPTEEELKKANEQWADRDMELIRMADAYALEGKMPDITGEHRQAALRRNVTRDWCKVDRPGQVCPGCGENVPQGIVIHGGKNGCGAIFDMEKAIKMGLAPASVQRPQQQNQQGQQR